MKTFSDKLKEKLSAMTRDFSIQLPDRISKIKTAAAAVLVLEIIDTEEAMAKVSELRMLTHKLAGSALTFGFGKLSELSKQLEARLVSVLEGGAKLERLEKEEILAFIREMEIDCGLDRSEEAVELLSDQVEIFEAPQVSMRSTKNLLYFVPSRGKPRQDVIEYMSLYGYHIQQVGTLEELSGLLSKDTKRLVFTDTCVLENIESCQEKLHSLKKSFRESVSIIFFSTRDDFNTRLAAVRAGGDAFIPMPLDMVRVMDQIDSLLFAEKKTPYHILIVDDDPEQVSYHALLLQQAGMITSVATDPKQVVKILVEAKPELILMDMYMPGCDGVELAAIIRQQTAFVGVPIVFLSVETDLEKQLDAIRFGGDDFLTKPIKEEHLIASIRNRAERTRSMRYLMERDSLTGLLNHTNLKEQLAREILRSQRTGGDFSFAMIDVDHFKKVNDTYGHLTGDNILKGLARLLRDRLRVTDIVGRYGGEEFGVILLNTNLENAKRIIDEIRINFSQIKQRCEDKEFNVMFSCGIAAFPEFKSVNTLNEAADRALYAAKEGGRNKVVVAHEKNGKTDNNPPKGA